MPSLISSRTSGPFRRGRKLWQNEAQHSLSLGCTTCPDLGVCGGLRIAAAVYSCLDLCRCPPSACISDTICRRSTNSFVKHFNEVGGFDLDNIPSAALIAAPELPQNVPVIYHGRRRAGGFRYAAAALSLYSAVTWKDGAPRYETEADLRAAFGLAPDIPLILSGTATDPTIERWWSHEAPRRRAAIAELRQAAGNVLITVPNFSLFRDIPRQDNLHAMKRIAIAWWEFVDGGVPAALHLNARTERDYERWTRFVSDRPEVTHVAFEFGTSAGKPGRREWHTAQLVALANNVGRPVHLVVRGGLSMFEDLAAAFSRITLMDTTAFMKTVMRRRLTPVGNMRLEDVATPTPHGALLDDLLDANVHAVEVAVAKAAAPPLLGRLRA